MVGYASSGNKDWYFIIVVEDLDMNWSDRLVQMSQQSTGVTIKPRESYPEYAIRIFIYSSIDGGRLAYYRDYAVELLAVCLGLSHEFVVSLCHGTLFCGDTGPCAEPSCQQRAKNFISCLMQHAKNRPRDRFLTSLMSHPLHKVA